MGVRLNCRSAKGAESFALFGGTFTAAANGSFFVYKGKNNGFSGGFFRFIAATGTFFLCRLLTLTAAAFFCGAGAGSGVLRGVYSLNFSAEALYITAAVFNSFKHIHNIAVENFAGIQLCDVIFSDFKGNCGDVAFLGVDF